KREYDLEAERCAFAKSLSVTSRNVWIFSIRANVWQHLPRAGATLAFSKARHNGNAGYVIKTEGFNRAFVLLDRDRRGDGDFGEVLTFERHCVACVRNVDHWGCFERGANALFAAF